MYIHKFFLYYSLLHQITTIYVGEVQGEKNGQRQIPSGPQKATLLQEKNVQSKVNTLQR
jgi:hypothetical protein